MEYKIEYETYNNSDFIQTVFCKTKKETGTIVSRLQKLKHVTKVAVKPISENIVSR